MGYIHWDILYPKICQFKQQLGKIYFFKLMDSYLENSKHAEKQDWTVTGNYAQVWCRSFRDLKDGGHMYNLGSNASLYKSWQHSVELQLFYRPHPESRSWDSHELRLVYKTSISCVVALLHSVHPAHLPSHFFPHLCTSVSHLCRSWFTLKKFGSQRYFVLKKNKS